MPEPNEPIADDFRDDKDGRENGALKLIAGLLGVPLDELVQREKQAERSRRFRANAIATAMAVLALGALAAGAVAWVQREAAVRNAEQRDEQRRIAEKNAGLARFNEGVAKQKSDEAIAEAMRATKAEGLALVERDNARQALMRTLIERAWSVSEGSLMAKYALTGQNSPQHAAIYRAALANSLDGTLFKVNIPFVEAASGARFSRDGRLLAITESNGVSIWRITSDGPELVFKRVTRGRPHAAFDATGQRLTILLGDRLLIDDLTRRAPIVQIMLEGIVGSAFSPDGARLLIFSLGGGARLWDTSSGQALPELIGHAGTIRSAVFSRDGTRIVTSSEDRTTRLWSASDGRAIAVLVGHTAEVRDAQFSPDGSQIVTASGDRTVRIWNALDGRSLTVMAARDDLEAATFSADGTQVFATDQASTFYRWRGIDGHLMQTASAASQYRSVFSADGSLLVSAGRERARVWEAASQHQIAQIDRHLGTGPAKVVSDIVLSPDGHSALFVQTGGSVVWWDFSPALLPVADLERDTCAGLRQAAETRFTPFEIASDDLLSTWLGSGRSPDLCVTTATR